MKSGKLLKVLFIAIFSLTLIITSNQNSFAEKNQNEIKLGVLFSMTGSFAPAGALAGYRGSMIAINMVNDKGGVLGKYKINPIVADAQSNPDIALREAQRLISVENVPTILGVFSSSIAVPLAPICEKNDTIFWPIIAISDSVVKDRNLKYTLRVQPMGSQWGESSVQLLIDHPDLLGRKDASNINVAIIHEDGPYGTTVSQASKSLALENDMNIVLNEAYSHNTKDLSSLIMKLKNADADVILHTGYFPDIVLFFRQARELGLKWKALIGHGAGHANFDDLKESLTPEFINYLTNVDPAPAQILDQDKLSEGMGDLINEFLERYEKEYGTDDPETHATQGFGHTWVLLEKVFPLALKEYGEITADTIRKAALQIDIPEGKTPCGYGVKFAPPEHDYAGQNLRSYPVLTQFINGNVEIIWPDNLKTADPKIPWPSDSIYAE